MTHEELILKAKDVKTVEEILAIAQENGMDVSCEDAEMYIQMNRESGELSDEDLDNITGGAAYTLRDGYLIVTNFHECDRWQCDKCGGNDIQYMRVASESGWDWAHKCGGYPNACGKSCANCQYMKYRFPFQICTHPDTRK